jgi:hypothetical protein
MKLNIKAEAVQVRASVMVKYYGVRSPATSRG